MRIISKYPEYYDYISHLYDGRTDNKCIYERKHINIPPYENKRVFVNYAHEPLRTPYSNNSFLVWLFVAGKSFLCRSHYNSTYTLVTQSELDKMSMPLLWLRTNKGKDVQDFMFIDDPVGVAISKEIGCPVFFYYQSHSNVKDVYTFDVVGELPCLADIGMPSIYPAEQCFQDISFYISNVLTKREEPASISDMDKLKQHGFDSKSSFRHRK